jgi:hypothetical protein
MIFRGREMHVDAMAEEIPLAWRKKAPVVGAHNGI